MDNNVVYGPIEGAQRILTVYEDHILLQQVKNMRSFMTHDFFNGDKEIYFSDMISCQYKVASSMILGYLQFETPGVTNRDNFGSENSFTFYNKDNALMEKVASYVKGKIREAKAPKQPQIVQVAPNSSSYLDELMKLKDLKDAGVISEEEFAKMKAEIMAKKDSSKETMTQSVSAQNNVIKPATSDYYKTPKQTETIKEEPPKAPATYQQPTNVSKISRFKGKPFLIASIVLLGITSFVLVIAIMLGILGQASNNQPLLSSASYILWFFDIVPIIPFVFGIILVKNNYAKGFGVASIILGLILLLIMTIMASIFTTQQIMSSASDPYYYYYY